MVKESLHTEEQLAAVVFVGQTLGPLFSQDPAQGDAGALYRAFSEMDPDAAAAEWPFAAREAAAAALGQMVGALADMRGEAADVDGEAADVGDGMPAASDEVPGARVEVPADIVEEYRRLFVGPAKKAAPPWGSVYTDHEGVIFGATALDLHDWLSAHGVLVAAGDRMPDDHIGRMLELMAWIAEQRPELLDDYLSGHLLTWSGHFLERVERESAHPFFTGLARLCACTLDGIQAEFSLQPTTPRFYR